MNFERTKNSTRTLLFGLLNRLITIILPFVTRTMIIYKLGTEYAGISSLFTSILSVLSISELGIGTAIIFCMNLWLKMLKKRLELCWLYLENYTG